MFMLLVVLLGMNLFMFLEVLGPLERFLADLISKINIQKERNDGKDDRDLANMGLEGCVN